MFPRALLAVAILITITALACTAVTTSAPPPGEPPEIGPSVATPPPVDPPPVDTRTCAGVRLEDPVTVIVEDTSVRLSGAQVTAGSIIMRWVKRDSGVSEHLSSARISTTADTTGTTVSIGTSVPIGADRYCVVDIAFGRSEPGSVSLQKVAP